MTELRNISCREIIHTVKNLFIKANTSLTDDVRAALCRARQDETSPLGQYVLDQILENEVLANRTQTPVCQDTGIAIVFLELGQDVHITGGNLYGAVSEGVRLAYADGYLRKSLCDPLSRTNTTDNLPPVIYTDVVSGNHLKIVAMPKGGGSENMSGTAMLLPADGCEGIKKYIVDRVKTAGPNPCPPIIVGAGIGGTMEQAALLAKKALLRPVGLPNPNDERLRRLEEETLAEINKTGIGPQGYGGCVTALAVQIDMRPCHIAGLPVSVAIQCHAARHQEALL
ncbi:MAG: fumarate hydratase [Syntrophobacterales bacterium]|jgi:fumarate hydratase subunit alpha|nr:fumarate hydratase [Syntrophobacterales bacterium]